jgi:outer membrane protein TolC
MNRTKRKLLIFMLLGVWSLPLMAQTASTPQSLSLQQAKEYALANSKTIKTSQLDIEIAKKKVKETTAIGLPQVELTGNYQHLFKVPEFGFPQSGLGNAPLFPAQNYPDGYSEYDLGNGLYSYSLTGPGMPIMEKDNATFDLKVSQLIFSGEYIVGLQAAKVYRTISEQALKKNQIDLAATVESSYYLVLILGENLNIVKQNVELTKQTLTELDAMLKSGFIEDTEVDQLRLNLSSLNNLAISLEGQQKNALNLLKYQMGMDLNQQLSLTDNLTSIIDGIGINNSAEFNFLENIDYQMVDNQVAIQRLNLKREKSTFLPTLAAFYQHEELAKEPALNFTPKDILGVSLTLPIFSSGQRLMKVKQAKLALQQSEITRANAADGLILQYENQKLACNTAYNTYLNQKESTDLSKKVFDKTTVKLKAGVSSSLELTQVQAQYLTSVSSYYSSVLNLLNARAELQKILSK